MSEQGEIRADQGKRADVGYGRPPAEHRFQPGESGNPSGRAKNAGSTIKEWLNAMADFTGEELVAVMEDAKAPAAKQVAARLWIDAKSSQCDAIGKPIAGVEFDRIMDRTEGKPRQETHLTSDGSFKEEPTVLERLPGEPQEG